MELNDKPHVPMKRRKQVKSACGNCRKSKTACSDERPCTRCVNLCLSDTCKDVPRKKREKKKPEEYEGTDCFRFVVYKNNPYSSSNQRPIENTQSSLQCSLPNKLTTNSQSHNPQSLSPNLMQQLQVPCSPDTQDFLVPTMEEIIGSSSPEETYDNYADAPRELSRSSFAYSPGDTSALYSELEALKKEQERKNAEIQSLQNALSTQKFFCGMALTRWKISSTGVCYLQSFSEGFSSLIGHDANTLHSCFTCVQMYTPREYSSTQKFLRLLGSGRVDSLGVRVPLLRGTGELWPVFSMISVEFENGNPSFATICMNKFDILPEEEVPFWEPTMVKIRSFRFQQNNYLPQQQSQTAARINPSNQQISGNYEPEMQSNPLIDYRENVVGNTAFDQRSKVLLQFNLDTHC